MVDNSKMMIVRNRHLTFQQNAIQILRRKSEIRKDSDIQVLLPFLKQIKFFQDKPDIKEQDLIFLCDRAKYEHYSAHKIVFSHGNLTQAYKQ